MHDKTNGYFLTALLSAILVGGACDGSDKDIATLKAPKLEVDHPKMNEAYNAQQSEIKISGRCMVTSDEWKPVTIVMKMTKDREGYLVDANTLVTPRKEPGKDTYKFEETYPKPKQGGEHFLHIYMVENIGDYKLRNAKPRQSKTLLIPIRVE